MVALRDREDTVLVCLEHVLRLEFSNVGKSFTLTCRSSNSQKKQSKHAVER